MTAKISRFTVIDILTLKLCTAQRKTIKSPLWIY